MYFFYMTWLVKLQFEWQYWISCSIFSACIHLLNIYRPHILVNHLKRHESDVIMYIPKQWKWPFIMGNQGDRFWNEISMSRNVLLTTVIYFFQLEFLKKYFLKYCKNPARILSPSVFANKENLYFVSGWNIIAMLFKNFWCEK